MAARWERSLQRLIYWLFILIASGLILYFFIQVSGVNQYNKARLGDMVYGTAYRPLFKSFGYRALLPTVVSLFSPLIPSGLWRFPGKSLAWVRCLAGLTLPLIRPRLF